MYLNNKNIDLIYKKFYVWTVLGSFNFMSVQTRFFPLFKPHTQNPLMFVEALAS